jgi:hypothetical protein
MADLASKVWDYVVVCLWGWWGLVVALLTVVQVVESWRDKSLPGFPKRVKVTIAIGLLFVSQFVAYREKLDQVDKMRGELIQGKSDLERVIPLEQRIRELERDTSEHDRLIQDRDRQLSEKERELRRLGGENEQLRSQLRDLDRRKEFRNAIGELMPDGRRLHLRCLNTDFNEQEADAWARRAEDTIRKHGDNSMVMLFRDQSGVSVQFPRFPASITDDNARRCSFMQTRLLRLSQLLMRLQ